jgi:hypothetical protein
MAIHGDEDLETESGDEEDQNNALPRSGAIGPPPRTKPGALHKVSYGVRVNLKGTR